MESISTDLLTSWIKHGHTYEWICNEMKVLFPEKQMGLSARYGGPFSSPLRLSQMFVLTQNCLETNGFADLKPINNRHS